MQSSIRLFKSIPVETKEQKAADPIVTAKTVRLGFIFAPEVIANYDDLGPLIKMVEKSYGMSAEKLNASFHKSWKKIAEADIEQLVIEQLTHYITTYGFQAAGIYSEDTVYIPSEKLDIPDIDGGFRLIVINGVTKDELKDKLIKLLGSGIALGEETKKDVLDVATFVGVEESEIGAVRNTEVRIALYDYLGIAPHDPIEFLRFAVYKATNETLLIKNNELISKIKEKDNLSIVKMFEEYENNFGLERLAEIFYRFKPLFLAFRVNKRLRVSVNRIRRLAKKNHKPMREDYLNDITSMISKGQMILTGQLKGELDKVNTFRKVRLAYALKYRTKDVNSILYRIRNGKGYVKDFSFPNKKAAEGILNKVLESIADDLKDNVGGKKIFIPEFIHYTLPATEKQFTGMFPSGTYVEVKEDMMVGINWHNIKGTVDLDLSLVSSDGKFGWDGMYRSAGLNILFSGDIVDACGKDGATELFYLKNQQDKEEDFILFANYFNFNRENKVPFKIMVASEKTENFGKNYMVDPNNLVTVATSQFDGKRQLALGVISATSEGSRFYFAQTAVGGLISSGVGPLSDGTRNYLINFYKDSIDLKDIFEKAGAVFVDDVEEADIDLSPESLEKDTIINLLTK